MLVEQRSLPTTLAGASLTGAALTWSLGAWLQGRPGLRTPRAVLVTLGFVFVLAGIGLVAVATSDAVPAVTAAIGWVVAGLGMGLGLTSLSVLVLELSPISEQGVNASALQVSDALGSIIMIGTAGAVFAALATGGDARRHAVPGHRRGDGHGVRGGGTGRASGPARHALAQGQRLADVPGDLPHVVRRASLASSDR
jgi:MFS family permease